MHLVKATSFDIAYRAGVSQSTVSRALRNSPLVNEETRLKIQAIARELNYKVDKNARNLRSQQSHTIALLLFEDKTIDDSQINPFFLSMLASITRACSLKGYDLLVSFQEMNNDWHAEYEDTNRADGLILLGYGDYVHYKEKLKHLSEKGTHFIRWGAEVKDMSVATIGCDNINGSFQLTKYILAKGKKSCAFIGTASHRAPELYDRYRGHCQALENAGFSIDGQLQVDAMYTEEGGYLATKELIARNVSFDSVFAATDLIAIGAMRALKEHGFKIPDDVSLVGFDDIPIASFTSPALTTAKQDTVLAGQLLVDNLLKLIAGEKPSTLLIPTQIIERKSC